MVLRVGLVDSFLVLFNPAFVGLVQLGHLGKLLLDGYDVLGSFVLLILDKLHFVVEIVHQVVVDVLVLGEDLVLLEVLPETLFLLVCEELQLS
jgi:hypothetical protein